MAIRVETVTSPSQLRDVRSLVYRAYREKKYCLENEEKELNEHPNLDLAVVLYASTRVIRVVDDDRLVGTVSMTLDGSEGLPTDRTFPRDTDEIRAEGRAEGHNLGAVWRLAVSDKENRSVVGTLFDAVYDWLVQRCLSTALYVVHPSHEKFYRRIIGATVVAAAPNEVGLYGAPAVLVRLDEPQFRVWFEHRRLFYPCEPEIRVSA